MLREIRHQSANCAYVSVLGSVVPFNSSLNLYMWMRLFKTRNVFRIGIISIFLV